MYMSKVGLRPSARSLLEAGFEPVPPLSEAEIQKAYDLWRFRNHFGHLDESVTRFRDFQPFTENWLRSVREAHFRTAAEIAGRLGVSQVAYSRLETREADGKITLENLRKAAAALDCDLVYAFRPKNQRPFSEMVWERILPIALKQPWLGACDPRRRSLALAALARKVLEAPAFRQREGWGKNKRPPRGGLSKFKA